MVRWLFFDLGSTLIDESECVEYRLNHMLNQKNALAREELVQKIKENAEKNLLSYKDIANELGLEIAKWPRHLEKLYPDVPEILEKLHGKYQLGIIANQSLGTEERLTHYGIRHYFNVILASAEAGVSKPDLKIFQTALQKADCSPQEAYMIGDRLDNDIEPAAQLGMLTIWVRQGINAYGNPNLISHKPGIIVNPIQDILNYL